MFKIDFGWCMLENVEKLLLFVLLHAWAQAYVCSLDSCLHNTVLAYVGLFLRLCIRGVLSMYVGFDPRTWDVWQKPCSAHFHFFFIYFTSICNFNTPLCHFSLEFHYILPFIFILASKTLFFYQFCLNQESNVIFFLFLQSSSPYTGKGSINKVVEWYNLLVTETRAYIQEAGFEPIIGLLLKNSASATLV